VRNLTTEAQRARRSEWIKVWRQVDGGRRVAPPHNGDELASTLFDEQASRGSLAQRNAEVRKGMDLRFVPCPATPVLQMFVAKLNQ
jgi:hypothetical protein